MPQFGHVGTNDAYLNCPGTTDTVPLDLDIVPGEDDLAEAKVPLGGELKSRISYSPHMTL